jgi:hypothetical protein
MSKWPYQFREGDAVNWILGSYFALCLAGAVALFLAACLWLGVWAGGLYAEARDVVELEQADITWTLSDPAPSVFVEFEFEKCEADDLVYVEKIFKSDKRTVVHLGCVATGGRLEWITR